MQQPKDDNIAIHQITCAFPQTVSLGTVVALDRPVVIEGNTVVMEERGPPMSEVTVETATTQALPAATNVQIIQNVNDRNVAPIEGEGVIDLVFTPLEYTVLNSTHTDGSSPVDTTLVDPSVTEGGSSEIINEIEQKVKLR